MYLLLIKHALFLLSFSFFDACSFFHYLIIDYNNYDYYADIIIDAIINKISK